MIMRQRARSRLGFTLIEMMVAIGLLSVLGLMLVTALRETASLVGVAQSRGDAIVRAQALINNVEADLTQMYSGPGGRLAAGLGPNGRQFITFVRVLPEEERFLGGYFSGGVYGGGDQRMGKPEWEAWYGSNSTGHFRALSGLAEVCYVIDPLARDSTLYRGIRAPIEFPSTSPTLADMQVLAPWTPQQDGVDEEYRVPTGGFFTDMQNWFLNGQSPESSAQVAEEFLRARRYQPIATDCLHMGILFAHNESRSWEAGDSSFGPIPFYETASDADLAAILSDVDGHEGWPARSKVRYGNARWREVRNYRFPRAAKISVTMDLAPPLRMRARLRAPLAPGATTIQVDSTAGFPRPGSDQSYILIGDEWIYYNRMSANSFGLAPDGRGRRGTIEPINEPHPVGSVLSAGITFERIVTIPAGN